MRLRDQYLPLWNHILVVRSHGFKQEVAHIIGLLGDWTGFGLIQEKGVWQFPRLPFTGEVVNKCKNVHFDLVRF